MKYFLRGLIRIPRFIVGGVFLVPLAVILLPIYLIQIIGGKNVFEETLFDQISNWVLGADDEEGK